MTEEDQVTRPESPGVDAPSSAITQFRSELESLINRHSMENDSNTPDFMLAEYLTGCLRNFNSIMTERERWYGRGPQLVSTGGWATHHGGERPVKDDVTVDILLDSGERADGVRAGAWEWNHARSFPNIISYRVSDGAHEASTLGASNASTGRDQ